MKDKTYPRADLTCVLVVLSLTAAFGVKAELLHSIDFTGHPDGPAVEWLEDQGFNLRLNAEEVNPQFRKGRLLLQTDGQHGGLFEKSVDVPNATRVRIQWGVERYPQGANWAEGVNAVAIAVMTTFGDERLKSGSAFAPNAPHFIGIFLGENERADRAYMGKYYHAGGRYYCAPCGVPTGETIVTEFYLGKAFNKQFPVAATPPGSLLPPVSRIGFQMNTIGTQGGAVAFLERVEYYSN